MIYFSRVPKKVTYQLYYHATDERFVDGLETDLGKLYSLRKSHAGDADLHLALITHRTPKAWISDLKRYIPRLVCIVATSIRLPSDEVVLRQYQWIDYRLRSLKQLDLIAAFLTVDV